MILYGFAVTPISFEKIEYRVWVPFTEVLHLIPSRTQQLSLLVPMILLVGKVGRRPYPVLNPNLGPAQAGFFVGVPAKALIIWYFLVIIFTQ